MHPLSIIYFFLLPYGAEVVIFVIWWHDFDCMFLVCSYSQSQPVLTSLDPKAFFPEEVYINKLRQRKLSSDSWVHKILEVK